MTPLHYAASCGRTDVVIRLLRAGADVNAQNVRHFFFLPSSRLYAFRFCMHSSYLARYLTTRH
jgi:ankyrin repeat protein